MMHSIRRTSPKGQQFVGICVLCGQENLLAKDAAKECPNIRGLTQDEALIEQIKDVKP